MSAASIGLEPVLQDYLLRYSSREDKIARTLREVADEQHGPAMRSSIEQMQFLDLLLKLMGAKRAIEVGVFTGYGTLAIARAVGKGGHVFALDVTDEYLGPGRKAWADADVADRIMLKIAPALDSLDAAIGAGDAGSYDFAYVDADKANYPAYFERCLTLLRPGGLIAFDNVLWGGRVAGLGDDDPLTPHLQKFNALIAPDERVDLSMVPIGDGVTLARKR